jgi:hypothetical protein
MAGSLTRPIFDLGAELCYVWNEISGARIASSAKFRGDKLVRGGDRSRIRVEFEIFEERTGLHGVGAKL